MKDYLTLTKPRIAIMVAATAYVGYHLAGGRDLGRLAWLLLGVALASGGTGTLNQWLEIERDARMRRTAARPLPAGRLAPVKALVFGIACGAAGISLLWLQVGSLSAGLTLFTMLSYLLLYTPLKTRTPHSTWVGAVAGAMPPLIGWAGADGSLAPAAWALFAIQFLWQIPHFLAMFWIHREDYAAAGFRVMPVVDPGGRATSAQIALHSFALVPASLMPTWSGLAGSGYGLAALALGTAFMGMGLRASWTMAVPDARRLFLASLAYLPLLFGLLLGLA